MPNIIKKLDFTTEAAADPFTAVPTGWEYSVGSQQGRIVNISAMSWAAKSVQSNIIDITPMQGTWTQSTVQLSTSQGNGAGNGVIAFSNQAAYHCDQQEVICNTLSCNNATPIVFNIQALVAGNTEIGQNIGAVNQRIVRNTLISTTSSALVNCINWVVFLTQMAV